jgi:hypothetical protein
VHGSSGIGPEFKPQNYTKSANIDMLDTVDEVVSHHLILKKEYLNTFVTTYIRLSNTLKYITAYYIIVSYHSMQQW